MKKPKVTSMLLLGAGTLLLLLGLLAGCRPPEEDSLGRLCVLMHHCGVWKKGDQGSISACVEHIDKRMDMGERHYEDLVRCVNEAGKNCEKIFACQNEGTAPAACVETAFQDTCSGLLAVSCGERGLVTHDDCAAYRQDYSLPFDWSCVFSDRYARCEPPACQGLISTCVGGFRVFCDEETEQLDSESCPRTFGTARCTEPVKNQASCEGTGPPCAPGSSDRCEGDLIVRCIGGREARLDCTRIGPGYTCTIIEEEGVCGGKGTSCVHAPDEATGGDSCDGTVLRYCHAGDLKELNCTSLGFGTCAWRPDIGVAWCEN